MGSEQCSRTLKQGSPKIRRSRLHRLGFRRPSVPPAHFEVSIRVSGMAPMLIQVRALMQIPGKHRGPLFGLPPPLLDPPPDRVGVGPPDVPNQRSPLGMARARGIERDAIGRMRVCAHQDLHVSRTARGKKKKPESEDEEKAPQDCSGAVMVTCFVC